MKLEIDQASMRPQRFAADDLVVFHESGATRWLQ